MKYSRNLGIPWIGLVIFFSAVCFFSGCGGPKTPESLANEALSPANTPEEKAVQEKAILELAARPKEEPGVIESLRRVLKESEVPAVRRQAMQGLRMMKDFDSGPYFIKAMSSEDKMERGEAYNAISDVTGMKIPWPGPEATAEVGGAEAYQDLLNDAIAKIKNNYEGLVFIKASKKG